MRFFHSYSLTKITGLFILIAMAVTICNQGKWNNKNEVIGGDVRGYYAYLPALFIHQDLKFENIEDYKKENGYRVWVKEDKKHRKYIKYSTGMAMMYSPFFLVSHAAAKKKTGFSRPYKIGLICSAFFYLIIGLVFLSRFLLRYFEDRVVSITLLILYFGTNMFQYQTGHMTYSHTYSFALIAVFLYTVVKWLDQPSYKYALWMGLTAGMIVLIRPIDIIFLSFFILFGIQSFDDLKARFKTMWIHKGMLFAFFACMLLMFVPQFLYNYHIFGHIFYYSYTKEGFFFLSPHLYDSMLNYRNGWLIYSPIMILSLIGFFFIYKQAPKFKWFTPFVFITYFYVIASWWCWWYAGFGNRAYINLYPILAISLCALVTFMMKRHWSIRTAFNGLVFGFILLNLFQTWQFEKRIIHWGFMTKDAYWNVFGRTTPSQVQYLYLDQPHLDKALLGKDVVSTAVIDTLSKSYNGFENTSKTDPVYGQFVQRKYPWRGKKSLYIPGHAYALQKLLPLPENTNYIYISAWVRTHSNLRIVVSGGSEIPFYGASNAIEEVKGEWQKLNALIKLPEDRKFDELSYFIWNKDQLEYFIDGLEVKCLNVKKIDVEG